jgi:hypothetical protein
MIEAYRKFLDLKRGNTNPYSFSHKGKGGAGRFL